MGYWSEIKRRTTERTNKALGLDSMERLIVAGLLAVILILGLIFVDRGQDAQSELIIRGLLVLAVVLAWPFLWVINYFREQPKIYDEQKRDLDEASRKLDTRAEEERKATERKQMLKRLGELIESGIAHRNKNIRQPQYEEWNDIYQEWRSSVLEVAEKVSITLYGNLKTCGTTEQIPQGLPPPANNQHEIDRRVITTIVFRIQKYFEANP